MGFSEEYEKLRKKELEAAERETDSKAKTFSDAYNKLRPKQVTKKKQEEWSLEAVRQAARNIGRTGTIEPGSGSWFTGGAFDDGYDFGDLTRTVLGTASDAVDDLFTGAVGIVEPVIDTGAFLAGGVGSIFGADEFADDMRKFIKDDLIDEEAVGEGLGYINPAKWGNALLGGSVEENSVFGEKADALAQSGGQLAATVGLQAVHVPWWVTTSVTSFGSAAETALKEGGGYGEATLRGVVSAGAEVLTEKLFGGSGLKEKGMFNLDGLTKGIADKAVKALADFGVDMAAEGVEEVVSEFINNLGSALYEEEDLGTILASEEALEGYLDAFIGGAILSGTMNVGKVTNSVKAERDYRTGLTANEQKVFDSEYQKRLDEAGDISKKEKAKIYDEVMEDFGKGYFSPDSIKNILGEDTSKAYEEAFANEESVRKEYEELGKKKTLDAAEKERYEQLKQQMKLLDNGFIKNSFAEQEKRKQRFEADLSQYKDENARKTVENAMKYGLHNGTDAHEFVDFAAKLAAKKGYVVDFTNTKMLKESGKEQYGINADAKDIEAFVSESQKKIVVNMDSGRSYRSLIGHEITHTLETASTYGKLQEYLAEYAKQKGDYDTRLADIEKRYKGVKADAQKELTADLAGDYLLEDYEFIKKLLADDRNIFQKVYDEIKYMLKLATAGSKEARALEKAKHYYEKALREATKEDKAAEGNKYSISDSDGEKDVKTLEGGSVVKYSLNTWTPETQERVRENLVKAGYEADRVDKWIKDTNSIASAIAADKDRLDFEAADNQVMLKDNQEYIKTLDASTLCAKRLVYQGTFDAIQHRMPNTMLSSDDLIDLLNMMKEKGIQTPCGVCYVESRRRHLGKFAQEWLNSYNGEYKPNLDEVTTSDGLEALRKSHPQTYKDFVDAMNKKGSSNPKVVQLRTEYRNEIMSLTPAQIRKIEEIGGLRVQSFSDFETPHMLDMMQAVMDMSAKGLHSQAYTKVPNFAWVFGDTGIKINLSLIAEGNGFDADGNLAFSSTEGMDINEAMKLRDAYSQNVGTIIVGANDQHILACMADDRIDFIIPFHRSGWGMKELDMMGMSSYTDYTYGQKEHDLATGKGLENLYPPDYWDYTLTGKENAERYLSLCAKTGREPKFSKFLVNNGDGSYSLQPDGSTDGYWKTLIDFKMYDNEGNGAAQQKVQPNFNMTEAYRVLEEYEGGANSLPVANDVVEEFVAKYRGREEIAPSMSLARENEQTYGNRSTPVREFQLPGVEHITDIAPKAEVAKVAPGAKTASAKNDAKANIPPEQEEKIAQIRKANPKAREGSWWTRTVKMLNRIVSVAGDKGWEIENLSKKTGNADLEAKYDFMKNRSSGVAQEYIYEKLLPTIDKFEKYGDLFDLYTRHLHNISRMSLDTEEDAKRRAEIKSKLEGYTEKQIKSLASEKINANTPEERANQIRLAQEYIELGGERGKNKPIFGDSVTADVSRKKVAEYDAAYPEFKDLAKEVHDYLKALRQFAVDEGLIEKSVAEEWEKDYPYYVPTRRTDKQGANVSVPLDTKKTGVNNPFKKATGGNSDFEPLSDTLAKYTMQIFRAAHRNSFGIELKNTLKSLGAQVKEPEQDENSGIIPVGTKVKAHDRNNIGEVKSYNPETEKYSVFFKNAKGQTATVSLGADILTPLDSLKKKEDTSGVLEGTAENDGAVLTPAKNGKPPTFTVFENGKRVTFDITEELYNAIKPAEGVLADTYAVLNKPAEWYKKVLTEYDPFFALLRNPIKDAKDVLFNSRHAWKTYITAPKALSEIKNMGEYFKEYIRNGGKTTSYYNPDTGEFTNRTIKKPKTAKNLFTVPFEKYKGASEKIEMFWRLSEYIASREAGESIEKAMLDAARVTTNFGAGGDLTRWANRNGALFLNPSVQGAMQIVRNVREAYKDGLKGSTILAAKVIGVGLSGMVFNWLLWDDDEEYEELSDYVKQNYFLIGKFGDGQFIRIPKGRMEAVIQNGFEQIANLITGDDDVDMETFLDLVGNNLAPTSPFGNNILSPILQAWDNEAWYGDDIVPSRLQDLPAAEQYDESTDSISKWLGETFNLSPYKINYVLKQYGGGIADLLLPALTDEAEGSSWLAPIADQFVSDSVLKNQNVTDFYDLKDELTASANSMYATDEDELRSKYINYINSELSDLYKEKREIQNSNRSDEKKYKAAREVQKQIDELAKIALDTYDSVSISGDYATVGDLHFRLNEKDEWTRLTDKQVESMKAFTSSVGVNETQYFKIKSDLGELSADKNSDGSTVSGSRKAKVIKYINSLDVEYGAKIILYKSEYPSDDTYNEDILDYLNSREGLSYADVKSILKELGFTVYADGRVGW